MLTGCVVVSVVHWRVNPAGQACKKMMCEDMPFVRADDDDDEEEEEEDDDGIKQRGKKCDLLCCSVTLLKARKRQRSTWALSPSSSAHPSVCQCLCCKWSLPHTGCNMGVTGRLPVSPAHLYFHSIRFIGIIPLLTPCAQWVIQQYLLPQQGQTPPPTPSDNGEIHRTCQSQHCSNGFEM